MSKIPPNLRLRSATLFALATLSACGGDGGTSPNAEPQPPEGATLALFPSVAYQAPGSTQQFHALLRDADGLTLTGHTVRWASTNSAVATIDGGTGLTTAVASGKSTIIGVSGSIVSNAILEVTAGDGGRIAIDAEQFVLIQPGTFSMGSDNGQEWERPVHTVNITRESYLQKTEVTQAQWRAVMGSNPSFHASELLSAAELCGEDTCPVETVSWNEVQTFLERLNLATPEANYRLPTEAEWEYAARASSTGDFGGTGGVDEMAWYHENSQFPHVIEGFGTHPGGQKRANAWGLFDMHGNVAEWVQDPFSDTYYSVSPSDDPTGAGGGENRAIRGGSKTDAAELVRSASRNSQTPDHRHKFIGFRLARTP